MRLRPRRSVFLRRMAVSLLLLGVFLANISRWRFSVAAFATGVNYWSESATRRNSGCCSFDHRGNKPPESPCAPSPAAVLWSSSPHREGDGCVARANATKMSLFLEHMFREKGCEGERGDVEVRCDESTLHRRGLFVASEEGISEGEYVFAVPAASAWIVEDEEIDRDGGNRSGELSDAQRGLRFWKWQQNQNHNQNDQQQQLRSDDSITTISTSARNKNDDDRKPYLDILPTMGEAFDPTPDFWSEEEIMALEFPPIVERALSKKRSVEALAAETPGDVDVDDLRFATWLVNSRAVTVILEDGSDEDEDFGDGEDPSLTTKCVLVPLLDMINHSSDHPNAYFAVLGDDGSGGDNDDDNLYYAVVADRDLRRGEEILISYGSEIDSSVELLLQYGFVPETNPHDIDFWESFCEEEDNKNEKRKPPKPTKNSGNKKEKSGNNASPLWFWTTTLQEDENRLEGLNDDGSKGSDIAAMRKILEFRIRMKRAYAEIEWHFTDARPPT